MRGEYRAGRGLSPPPFQLPPRARRIRGFVQTPAGKFATTSACAENTGNDTILNSPRYNYLRVRGEYEINPMLYPNMLELPPRTRRIQMLAQGAGMISGTTSAYAENTLAHSGV